MQERVTSSSVAPDSDIPVLRGLLDAFKEDESPPQRLSDFESENEDTKNTVPKTNGKPSNSFVDTIAVESDFSDFDDFEVKPSRPKAERPRTSVGLPVLDSGDPDDGFMNDALDGSFQWKVGDPKPVPRGSYVDTVASVPPERHFIKTYYEGMVTGHQYLGTLRPNLFLQYMDEKINGKVAYTIHPASQRNLDDIGTGILWWDKKDSCWRLEHLLGYWNAADTEFPPEDNWSRSGSGKVANTLVGAGSAVLGMFGSVFGATAGTYSAAQSMTTLKMQYVDGLKRDFTSWREK